MSTKTIFIGGGFLFAILVVFIMVINPMMSGKNKLVELEEEVNLAWGQVENVYQRRLDLIPNMEKVVMAAAQHEKEAFKAIAEARTKVMELNIPHDLSSNPLAQENYFKAQAVLTNAISGFNIESYPNLNANQSFVGFMDELSGTENRISVERRRYQQSVSAYNKKVRSFPTSMYAESWGFEPIKYFQAEKGAEKAPELTM